MRWFVYAIGTALALFGILIFHPLLTLIGIGLSLTIFLPKEDNNAKG